MTGPEGAAPAAGFANQHQQQDIRKVVGTQPYDRSLEHIQREFAQVDPDSIDRACQAWHRMSSELFTLAQDIKTRAAAPLDQAWSGPTSPQAQNQLRMAEATTRELANHCARMATATDQAARYARQYKDSQPSTAEVYAENAAGAAKRAAAPLAIGGPVIGAGVAAVQVATGHAEGTDKAVKHMEELLAHYSQVTSTLPDNVQTTLALNPSEHHSTVDQPPGAGGAGAVGHAVGGTGIPSLSAGGFGHSGVPGHVSGISGSPGGGTGSGGHGIGGSADTGSGARYGGPGGVGSHLPGGVPGGAPAVDSYAVHSPGVDPYAAHSSLAGSGLGGTVAGFDPAGLGSGAGGGLGAGAGAGGAGVAGWGAGGSAAGLGAGRVGGGGPGSSAGGAGLSAGGAGAAGLAGQGAGAAGAVGGGRDGAGMAPMQGAGGHGEGEEERERSTWLMEDDDVWAVGGDVPPPVISG